MTPRSKSSGELGSPGASPTSDAARDDDSPLASPGTIPALSLPPLPPKAKTVLAQDSEEAFDPQASQTRDWFELAEALGRTCARTLCDACAAGAC